VTRHQALGRDPRSLTSAEAAEVVDGDRSAVREGSVRVALEGLIDRLA